MIWGQGSYMCRVMDIMRGVIQLFNHLCFMYLECVTLG